MTVLVYADLIVEYTISVEPGSVEYFVMVLGASISVEVCSRSLAAVFCPMRTVLGMHPLQ